ncbi:helix-turn-helix transcriptional regulator [Actinotalea solisilvae]|uniref:helix-turn-helix transcriptional regulator n=1 Tax=Actinotalea solisilvae TaxID=2072922 RepID=UPI0018F1B5C7|nr:helix-turn-helix domain-containing protein [Actinotalea solisilvae]
MTDQPDPGPGASTADLARAGALAEPVRRTLFDCVVRLGRAASREEVAAAAGVPVHTAKFHLDKLVEHGLLDVEFRRLTGRTGPGAGRPAKLYRRSAREVQVSLPTRRYDLAGSVLATAVESAARSGAPVMAELARAARGAGTGLGEAALARGGEGAGPRAALLAALADVGYDPAEEGADVVLRSCPFHALVADHTALVCGMNTELLAAAAAASGADVTARLEPVPGRCCVVLGPQATSAG